MSRRPRMVPQPSPVAFVTGAHCVCGQEIVVALPPAGQAHDETLAMIGRLIRDHESRCVGPLVRRHAPTIKAHEALCAGA